MDAGSRLISLAPVRQLDPRLYAVQLLERIPREHGPCAAEVYHPSVAGMHHEWIRRRFNRGTQARFTVANVLLGTGAALNGIAHLVLASARAQRRLERGRERGHPHWTLEQRDVASPCDGANARAECAGQLALRHEQHERHVRPLRLLRERCE